MSKLRIPRSFKEKDLNRSIYDLSQSKVTTFMQGLNIPLKFEIMKPKDEFTVDYRSMIESIPMVGKQLNDWKLRIMLFKSDLSNYYSWMDNNARLSSEQLQNKRHHTISGYPLIPSNYSNEFGFTSNAILSSLLSTVFHDVQQSTSMAQRFMHTLSVLPQVQDSDSRVDYSKRKSVDLTTFVTGYNALTVQPSSLLDFLEFPVHFLIPDEFNMDLYKSHVHCYNADYLLCYLDAVRNYLVNNQLDSVPYFVTVPEFAIGQNVSDGYSLFGTGNYRGHILQLPLSAIDEFFKKLRCEDDGVDLLKFCLENNFVDVAKWLVLLRYGGMFLAQYERDMLNGLLRTVDTENVEVMIDQETGSFSINQLRLANRKQLLKDRFGVAGGRWKNLLRTVWGSDDAEPMDIPELISTSSYYVAAKSVMSTSNTYDEKTETGSSLGQLGGVFNSSDLGAKKQKFYTGQHTIFFAVASLVPDVVYCNGLGKGLDIVSFDDEYYPQFDALGFEDVPRYKYNALPTFDAIGDIVSNNGLLFKRVVGKNIAFIDLISNVNRCHGAFTDDSYFETWVLKREFASDQYLPEDVVVNNPDVDITSYVNPMLFQYPFAVQSATDNNFIFQIAFDIRAVRSKGKYFMPTLGK